MRDVINLFREALDEASADMRLPKKVCVLIVLLAGLLLMLGGIFFTNGIFEGLR